MTGREVSEWVEEGRKRIKSVDTRQKEKLDCGGKRTGRELRVVGNGEK